jgi:hydroxyacylglutathione hydrolase
VQVIELSNTVFEGANRVYVFGADGDGPVTLVDVGFDDPAVRDSLVAGLADIGLDVDDIEQVLVTHFHRDHAGLAGWLQAQSGASVHVHDRDAPLVGRGDDAREAFYRLQADAFERWAMPPAKREAFWAVVESGGDSELGVTSPEVEPFSDGATFQAGERLLRARHLPGHADGHCGFEAIGSDGDVGRDGPGGPSGPRVLWSGDAVLPKYTPNVGGADVRVDRPLETYLESLAAVVEADYDRAYPGHRDPIDDPTARAREIVHHHRERTANVLNVLASDEWLTTWEVSAVLFGELEAVHILHGPGEAHAHLDHLLAHGLVERADRRYRLAPDQGAVDAAELDDLFPAV